MAKTERRNPLRTWRGPERAYDLVREGVLAVIAVSVLCVVAAVLWGSPDGGLTYPTGPRSPAGEAFSAKYWDAHDPSDFAQTSVEELQAATTTANYGPPFNQTPGSSQEFIGIRPAVIALKIFGLTQPINTAYDFVLAPVSALIAPSDPSVATAIKSYEAAGGDLSPGAPAARVASPTQQKWLGNYLKSLQGPHATITGTSASVPPGDYGPVPGIVNAELVAAHNGILDGYFQGSQQQLSTNTFKGTMFFSDGTLWSTIAAAQGIAGDQWGVMNELWNFPGQVWLWLYAGMYQIPWLNPSNNGNLDLDVALLMILFGFLLPMFAPWIPLVNRIPRWIPLHKIIFKRYWASVAKKAQPPGSPTPAPKVDS